MNFLVRFIATALIAAVAFIAAPSPAFANHDPAVSHTPYCAPTVGGGSDCSTWCYVPVGGGEPVCGEITCFYSIGNPEPVCTAVESSARVGVVECETVAPTASVPAAQVAAAVKRSPVDVAKISRLRAKVLHLRQRLQSR